MEEKQSSKTRNGLILRKASHGLNLTAVFIAINDELHRKGLYSLHFVTNARTADELPGTVVPLWSGHICFEEVVGGWSGSERHAQQYTRKAYKCVYNYNYNIAYTAGTFSLILLDSTNLRSKSLCSTRQMMQKGLSSCYYT